MVRNRKELEDLFCLRVQQMGRKGAQTKWDDLMWNQSQNVEKAKIKSRQDEGFAVKCFTPLSPQEKRYFLQKDTFRDNLQFL